MASLFWSISLLHGRWRKRRGMDGNDEVYEH